MNSVSENTIQVHSFSIAFNVVPKIATNLGVYGTTAFETRRFPYNLGKTGFTFSNNPEIVATYIAIGR